MCWSTFAEYAGWRQLPDGCVRIKMHESVLMLISKYGEGVYLWHIYRDNAMMSSSALGKKPVVYPTESAAIEACTVWYEQWKKTAKVNLYT